MSYIELPTKEDLSGKARELFEDSTGRWNYPPNIVRAYALAPEVMIAEDVWSKGVMYKGFLPRHLKEAIATVVSSTNNCDYCATSHSYAYTLAGGDEEHAEACYLVQLDKFDEKEGAALRFAQKATRDPKLIKKKDLDQLLEYYSKGEIIEIVTVIQQFMGYNWFVTILGLELEDSNPRRR